ncbi:MAG: DUF4184 family protein [Armatimonadetes bacterium]|nr:DUF4184 family protein [Armatimonadota bacterium]
MPFTPAHPAIILPLKRLRPEWFSLTGLIFGSIAPDFEYFLYLRPVRTISHTIPGIFLLDLPLALLAALLFHQVLKKPLIAHLPVPLDRRYAAWSARPWALSSVPRWLVFLSSCVIGAVSHLVWDGFTHEGGFFVQHWPALTTGISVGARRVPLFRLLQYGSSLVGLLVVAGALASAGGRVAPSAWEPVARREKVRYWLLVGVCALALGWWRGRFAMPTFALRSAAREFGIPAISGAAIGLMVASILFRRRLRRL